MLPVLGAFVVVLLGFVVHDTGAGQVTPSRVASHGLLLVGLVLLVVVHRRFGRPHLPSSDYSSALARTGMSPAGTGEPVEEPL